MQTFFEFVVGLIAVLVAAVLSQAGLNAEPRRQDSRDIHRTTDCAEPTSVTISTANQDC